MERRKRLKSAPLALENSRPAIEPPLTEDRSQRKNDPQQAGLAGTGLADQAYGFSGMNGQRDSVDGAQRRRRMPQRAPLARIFAHDAGGLQHRGALPFASRRASAGSFAAANSAAVYG